MKKIILILSITALFLGCSSYGKLKEGKEIINPEYGKSLASRYRGFDNETRPGYGIMVLKDGEIEHLAGYGMANIEDKKPITKDTKFRSWLIYYHALRIALLNLWEDGKLDLDAPITQYIPNIAEEYSSLKIDYILNRASGLPEFSDNSLKGDITAKKFLEVISKEPEFNLKPGTATSYESWFLNEVFLTALLEEVTGKNIADYLNREVFGKLDMNNTRTFPERHNEKSDLVFYKRRAKNLIPDIYTGPMLIGMDTTFTTMEDSAKFFNAIDYQKSIISEKVYEKYTSVGKLSDGSDTVDENNKYKQYNTGYFLPAGYKSVPVEYGLITLGYGAENMASTFYPEENMRIFIINNVPDGDSNSAVYNKVLPAIFPEMF